MALQFPGDAHTTEPRRASGVDGLAFAGRTAPTPTDQLPLDSFSSSPRELPELSTKFPVALQFPADGQETDATSAT
jgi:hypothetical protein